MRAVATSGADIHEIRLADYDVKLRPGIEYKWSAALVLEEVDRSTDLISAGALAYDPAWGKWQESGAALDYARESR